MMSSATDSSHKIEIEREETSIDKWPSECCIYKVPKKLRKVKEEAYTPKLISIGPIHHGNPELENMQMLKQKYCQKFFVRTKKAKEFESFIIENENKIREFYAEGIPPSGFANMILQDSVFIIELFRMTAKKKLEEDDDYILSNPWLEDILNKLRLEDEENKNDHILSKPWLEEGIKNDLILLENQLPLFFLNQLYSRGGDKECFFITLACIYFFGVHHNLKELSTEMKDVKHFTDLYRTFYRPRRSEIRDCFQNCFQTCYRPRLSEIRVPQNSDPLLYSATVLQNTAGLVFQKDEEKQFEKERDLLNIQLSSSCLTHCLKSFLSFKCLQTRLVVPRFMVQDGTEELFRNLMALEQCHYPDEAYICNYITLLDYLINSKEDVELLVDKRIIVNLLGSNKAVAKMVNKLCLEIVEIKSCYQPIINDLNRYCESPWNRNMASLINVYFRDIWRSTATVVGVLVLLITIFNFLKPFVFKNI